MKLTYKDRHWTEEEFNDVVDLTHLALKRLGLRPGHRLAVMTGNTPLHVFLTAVAVREGHTLVPIHQGIPDAAVAAQLRRARVDLAVTDDAKLQERLNLDCPVIKSNARAERWDELAPHDLAPARPDDLYAIVHTSGTTGTPKAIGLSRSAVAAHAEAAAERLASTADDVWLGVLPLAHVGGLALVDRCVRLGAHLVLLPKFNVDEAVAAIGTHQVTHASMVPTMLSRVLTAHHGAAPEHVKCLLVGGDRAPDDLVAEALERGWPVHTSYGLTEACSQVATAIPQELRQRPGTVGRPLTGLTVTILDADGKTAEPGTVGQIVVDGPTLGRNLHGPTKGPLQTGDSGRLDADGYLFTVGRRNDLIVTGGKNVDPAEVEGVLRGHSSVAEACIVGIDDPEWGAVVAAALVAKPGAVINAADLEAHCRKSLGGHQVPRRFLVLKRLPRTPAGKLDHAMIRRWIERQTPSTKPT